MDLRPKSEAQRVRPILGQRPGSEGLGRRRVPGGPGCILRELHRACDVAEAVRCHPNASILAVPKPCLLTQKLCTPRSEPHTAVHTYAWKTPGSPKKNKWQKYQLLARTIDQAAKQKLHPNVIDGALHFLRAIAQDEQFVRQRSLLMRLLHVLESSVYILDQEDVECKQSDRPGIPYFVGHHWLSSRLMKLKQTNLHMSEVKRRCERFENIRVQVQGRLMELDERRRRVSQVNALRKPAPLAHTINQPEEEEEEPQPEKPKESLDVAADRFAKRLAEGKSGSSSLIWLWGVWKLMHQQLLRRRRKKGELLERTLIGDLVAPFRHWMIFAVENRADSKWITYHTYLQERQMYTRTAMDLQNKKEDLVLDLQVSSNSCRRLAKQLESKRREREQLHQRLHDIQPEVMRLLLSRVLDLTLLDVLHTGHLERTRFRLHFLTRDLAPLLLSDEDSPWRLFGFSGDQVLTRWANHELAQFKLVANEVLEAMSKRNSEDAAAEMDIEWSARETEIYGDRCRLVRNMKQLGHLEDDHEGVLFAVVYGAVCAVGSGSAAHPVSLWPLDEKETEAKASAMCKAIRQVIPSRAKYLLQPSDVMHNKGGLVPSVLAVIFMTNTTLPCSAQHEVLHAATFAINSAIAQEAYREPRKKSKGQGRQDLSFAPVELPPEPQLDAQQRATKLRRGIQSWLSESMDDLGVIDAPTTADPVPKTIFSQIELLAEPWAVEKPQDFSPLLKPDEALSALLTLPPHELLLRWVNFHLREWRGEPTAGVQNLGELDLGLLLELLTKLAPDVMNLHEEEQNELRMAHNPTAAEAATLRLVLAVSTRCIGYEILTEEVLNDVQTDMMASFLAELMGSFRACLPVRPNTTIGEHMEQLASIVLEAANTETTQLVNGLCPYLRDNEKALMTSLEALRAHHKISEAVTSKLRTFALQILVKRSQGMPCDMCELAQQLPEGGQRGDLVAGNNIQATIAREMSRLPAPDAGHEIDLTFEKTALEELLKKHISTFRDVFRQYAREVSYEMDSRTRTITASIGTLEAAHVLVVSPRHLMKLYRDCRMHLLRLDPCEVEEIYNEVKMHHAMANQFEDVQRFETGLSLEMFVEALLTFACRCQIGHLAIHAFHDKMDHIIEKHLVPFAGSKQDNVVYQLLVDEALDELIDDFSPRLRSIFVAFASAKDDKSEVRSHDRQRHRGAVVKATVASTNKQALTMSLENFTEMLQVAGLMSETIHRACVGRIYMNLQALRVPEDEEIDEDGASPSISEDPDHLASLMEEDHAGASFQYTMCFQEFLDGLIILTLFKEPNPFVSFNTRLEKFFRSALLDPLFEFANTSKEARFQSLHQALDDAFQKDVSASGIARKLKLAED